MKHLATFETYAGEKGSQAYPKRLKKLQIAKDMENNGTPVKSEHKLGMYAKSLAKQGADYDLIRNVTGWYKNPHDQMWRYEINDSQIRYKQLFYNDVKAKKMKMDGYTYSGFGVKLGSFMDTSSTSLFKDYPEIATWDVCFYNLKDRITKATGSMDSENNRITFYKIPGPWEDLAEFNDFGGMDTPEQKSAYEKLVKHPLFKVTEEMKSTFVHELQHIIQHLEGFALGANTTTYEPKDYTLEEELASSERFYRNRYPELRKALDDLQTLSGKGLTMDELDVHPLVKHYDKVAKKTGFSFAQTSLRTKHDNGGNKPDTSEDRYYNTAGEIEARDVEYRRKYPKDAGYVIYNQDSDEPMPQHAGDIGIIGKCYNTYQEAEKDIDTVGRALGIHPDDLLVTKLLSRKAQEPYNSQYATVSRVNVRQASKH